jgi:hypothetical protein
MRSAVKGGWKRNATKQWKGAGVQVRLLKDYLLLLPQRLPQRPGPFCSNVKIFNHRPPFHKQCGIYTPILCVISFFHLLLLSYGSAPAYPTKWSFFVKYYSIAFSILPGVAGGLALELKRIFLLNNRPSST